MRPLSSFILIAGLCGSPAVHALTLEVQRFDNSGSVPIGYQNVTDGIDPAVVVNVSSAPFADYLIPNNSGSAGVTAGKFGGEFIVSSTVADMGGSDGGANNLANTDLYHVVFAWDDGDPLPMATDYYGVSWAGWGSNDIANLETRIDLATDAPVTVYHWFNDGWDYADGGHETLTGHELTVTHHAADDSVITEEAITLPSGGAEDIFGDARQFYSAIINVTRTAEGEYLLIHNTGANVGYRGTAVAPMEEQPTLWYGFEVTPEGYVDMDSEGWIPGFLWVDADPWIWSFRLNRYIYIPDDSGWLYFPR